MRDVKDSNAICTQAVKENRIFVTSNLKVFNSKLQVPRCCVHFKASPESKFKHYQNIYK